MFSESKFETESCNRSSLVNFHVPRVPFERREAVEDLAQGASPISVNLVALSQWHWFASCPKGNSVSSRRFQPTESAGPERHGPGGAGQMRSEGLTWAGSTPVNPFRG